ncbi:hypothetical protein RAD15_12175 [Bradyrhizobium sp. 14AA]
METKAPSSIDSEMSDKAKCSLRAEVWKTCETRSISMIAEAGFGRVTGSTHSLDLEGTTFIPSLTSLAHELCAADLLNVLRQRHELSKKLARVLAISEPVRRVIRTKAILPGLHA